MKTYTVPFQQTVITKGALEIKADDETSAEDLAKQMLEGGDLDLDTVHEMEDNDFGIDDLEDVKYDCSDLDTTYQFDGPVTEAD